SGLQFQPCAGSEPDCNCCLSNKYTYMQLRSPEVTRVNFHLSNGIFTGLPNKTTTNSFSLCKMPAAMVLTKTKRTDHITRIQSLQWFPVSHIIDIKALLLCYKLS